MAADKLNWNELRRAIMKRTDATEQEVTIFLNALIEQILNALKTEKQVKINGLGTFRLQTISPRKSVNIATGEEIIINGYNKVSFSPEASVKEMISNNPTTASTPKEKKKNVVEEEELTPIQKLGQQADEIVDLLADLGQKPNTTANIPNLEKEQEPTQEQNLQQEPKQDPVEETASSVSNTDQEVPTQPLLTENKIDNPQKEEPIPAKIASESTESTQKENKQKHKYHFFRDTLICVICLLIVLVCGYFFGRTALSNWIESLGQKETATDTTTLVEQGCQEETSDSVFVEPIDTVLVTEEVDVSTPTEIVYTDYLATEHINEGSRLTWLAYRYYGNKALWVYIYDANKDHLTDPNHIQVGTKIRIPRLSAVQQDTTNAQTKITIERLQAAANANAK